jgi:DNA-binding LytR/AlgR family response regulator
MPDNDDKLKLRTPKGEFVYVAPADVLFAKSLDHWVKVLVKEGDNYVWYESHSTLQIFLLQKGAGHLQRGSRFYGVNKPRVTHYHPKSHTLEFDGRYPVILEHPLTPYFF